jgi:hypothetical protein
VVPQSIWSFKTALHRLKPCLKLKKSPAHLIVGPPGSGKTCCLEEFVLTRKAKVESFLDGLVLKTEPGLGTPWIPLILHGSMLAALRYCQAGQLLTTALKDPQGCRLSEELVDRIFRAAEAGCTQLRVVLIIDDVDLYCNDLDELRQAALGAARDDPLLSFVVIVATCRRPPSPGWSEYTLGALDDEVQIDDSARTPPPPSRLVEVVVFVGSPSLQAICAGQLFCYGTSPLRLESGYRDRPGAALLESLFDDHVYRSFFRIPFAAHIAVSAFLEGSLTLFCVHRRAVRAWLRRELVRLPERDKMSIGLDPRTMSLESLVDQYFVLIGVLSIAIKRSSDGRSSVEDIFNELAMKWLGFRQDVGLLRSSPFQEARRQSNSTHLVVQRVTRARDLFPVVETSPGDLVFLSASLLPFGIAVALLHAAGSGSDSLSVRSERTVDTLASFRHAVERDSSVIKWCKDMLGCGGSANSRKEVGGDGPGREVCRYRYSVERVLETLENVHRSRTGLEARNADMIHSQMVRVVSSNRHWGRGAL